MAVPDLASLLTRLDQTTHTDRVRTMALLGRDHADDRTLGALLDGLGAQSEYHLRLALVAASTARHDDRLRAGLSHPSPRIRTFAFAQLTGRGVVPDDIVEQLLDGSAEERRVLRRYVNRHGRTDIADAAIDRVRDELGDREAGALLATCSEATVRRLLPELLHAASGLRSLARRQPDALFDHAEAQLHAASRWQRDRFWGQIDGALRELALADPERTLRLVEDLGPSSVVPHGLHPVLGALIRFDPDRLARLVASDGFVGHLGWQLPPTLRRNADRFAHADRVAIARALRERITWFMEWIASFAPSDRAAIFDDAYADLDVANHIWAPGLLDLLPRDRRHAEARRILGVRSIRSSDAATLQYTAFLPLDEAFEALAVQTRRPEPDDRATGYDLLIACARRERTPEALGVALDGCERLRNEQDPVRLRAIGALSTVPAGLVQDTHLDALRSLASAVVDARDTSAATVRQFGDLSFGLLRDAAADPSGARFRFALELLDQLSRPSGSIAFPRLDHLLPIGAERPLIDALMPRLERSSKLDNHRLTFSLVRALGRRASGHPDLQLLLELATTSPSDSDVRSAVDLWLADPHTRSERVERVLANDESTVTLHIVMATLDRSRQDLLDILLTTRPLRGRLLKGDVRFVPVLPGSFHRWLPRQCAAYRDGLDALIATKGTADWTRSQAIRTIARLPEIGAEGLTRHLASADVAIQEAALGGLAWTDRPDDALTTLLEQAGTDRARVAIYAATRCARFVRRTELRPPLEQVLRSDRSKVTSKKEAARLLGLHRPPGAIDVLVEVFALDGTHRDLRVAIGRSVRSSLDDARAWDVLGRLASGGDDEARSLLETTPTQLAPRHRERYAGLVVRTCGSGSQQVRMHALATIGSWARWSDQVPVVTSEAIADLSIGPEWRSALHSLSLAIRDGYGWSEVADLVATLSTRRDPPELDAGADRDRPSVQRVHAVLGALANLPTDERADHRAELLDVVDQIDRRWPLGPDELALELGAVDWDDPAAPLARIAGRLDAHPVLAAHAAGSIERALGRDGTEWDQDSLGDATDDLIGAATVGTGILALELTGAVGARFDWPASWRDRLRRLRAHPSADVAALAGRTWTSTE